MSNKVQLGLLVSVTVLLVCALPFVARVWFAPRETAARQPPPAASRSPMPTVAASTAPPTPGPAKPAGHEPLPTEGGPSNQTNTALDAARQKTEADKQRAERNTQMMATLNGKLLDPKLKVPQTIPEAASLMGQNLKDAARFKQRWGEAVPAAGTPEADKYAMEQDDLVTQSAALLKYMTDEKNAALLKQPGNVAQFQTVSLTGALALRDDQAQAVHTTLDGYYQQFFTQGLNSDARPETGSDARDQQRLALSQQAFATIAALLTPEQAAAFHDFYPAAGIWMFVVPFGGLPGVTGNF